MPANSNFSYRADVDGLRAIAVLAVIFSHAKFEFIKGGYLGVDIFFVISGFLITSILLKDLSAKKFSFWNFYIRRARRIIPTLYLVLTVCFVFSFLLFLPGQYVEFSKSLVASLTFTSNILFWLNESNYFAELASKNPLLHTWSLSVEEQYYVIFPILLIIAWKVNKKHILFGFVVVSFISLALAEWSWRNFPNANYYMLHTRSWELLFGAITAYISREDSFKVLMERLESSSLIKLLLFSSLVILFYTFHWFDESTNVPSLMVLLPVISTCVLILFSSSNSIVTQLLSQTVLVRLGLLSYSAYLWHHPIFTFSEHLYHTELSPAIYGILILLTLFVSQVSLTYYENIFRNDNILSDKKFTIGTIVFTFFLLFVGVAGIVYKGFPSRLGTGSQAVLAKIDSESEKRSTYVKYGECHWYDKLVSISIEEFIEKWNCIDKTENGILVVGDSHAADKAVALRTVGWDVGQLSGAGCSIREKYMTKDCKFLFDKLLENIDDLENLKTIVLANRYNEYELSDKAISEITEYWSRSGKQLVFLTSMPEFPHFKEQAIANYIESEGKFANGDLFSVDHHRSEASLDLLLRMADSSDYRVLDMNYLFCNLVEKNKCLPVIDGVVLMVDDSHLSVSGARLFGAALATELTMNQ